MSMCISAFSASSASDDTADYPEETHKVRSAEGYILTIHRIPYRVADSASSKPAVVLLHGLLGSSADWVIAGPQKGLGKRENKAKPIILPTEFIRRKVSLRVAVWTMTKC
jgi:predicted alpha/beta-fold hydrolase